MEIFIAIIIMTIFVFAQVSYYSKRALKNVEYTRSFSRNEVFAGEKLELIEVISNNKLIPVPWVRIESRISASLHFKKLENLDVNMDQFHKSVFFLGSYKRITRRHHISCLKRGYFDCGTVSAAAGDIFGLASQGAEMRSDAKLYVFPQILKPGELPDEALEWQGEIAVRRWILPDPVLVSGIREYRSGDSQKDIHWGATARSGMLQVKIRDFTVSPKIMLVFNSQISDDLVSAMRPEDVEFLENGINICASLAAFCLEKGLEVGFMSNGAVSRENNDLPYIAPASSQIQLMEILRQLSKLVIKMQTAIHTMLDRYISEGTSGLDIVIVSNYWSALLEQRGHELRLLGNTVTYVPISSASTEKQTKSASEGVVA